MSTKHTPKPWKMSIGPNAREIYQPETGHTICRAPVADAFPTVMWADNGPLITAAPELLEACKAALEIVGCYTIGSAEALEKKPVAAKLRAAITKAERRQ